MTESAVPAWLADAIPHGPHRMTVGLRPLAPAQWIEDGDDFASQLHERAVLLRERDDVLRALAGSQAAQRELLAILIEHLRTHFADRYAFSATQRVRIKATGQVMNLNHDDDGDDHALHTAAHLVPEDLCLLQRGEDGRYRLRAAALCFPTRWRLADKLDRPLLDIHAPVPGYAHAVGAATDRVLASLQPTRPLWRHNWSLLDSPALYQPERPKPQQTPDVDDPGERLWFRSERQTLKRLPQTGAVVFTIRIRQCTLAALCQVPGAATRLLTQLRSMPAPLKVYKGLSGLEPALCAYLRDASRVTIRA